MTIGLEPGEPVHAFQVEMPAGPPVGARHYAALGEDRPGVVVVLAHGAGAGHQHPFMAGTGSVLARHGLDVVTFNSPTPRPGAACRTGPPHSRAAFWR